MTDEEDSPPRIRRFRWAKSSTAYAREIEGIAALWVEGVMSRGEARGGLELLKEAAREDVDSRGAEIETHFLEIGREHAAIILDILCVQSAIEESERREDVTADERLATLREAIKRLQLGGLQK